MLKYLKVSVIERINTPCMRTYRSRCAFQLHACLPVCSWTHLRYPISPFSIYEWQQNLQVVVGIDATVDGCQSIADGDMQFTVYQSADGQGQKAVELANALATKGSADGIEGLSDDGYYIWVPFEKVDASNVKEYMK